MRLAQALGDAAASIEHIGSTSIPGILAKPIIDILIESPSLVAIDSCNTQMRALGYEVMGEFGIESRRYFRRSDPSGHRSHHIHTFATGSPHLLRHLAFRDYLITHPERAKAYSKLKERITHANKIQTEEYSRLKSPFIKQVEAEALKWATRDAHSDPTHPQDQPRP